MEKPKIMICAGEISSDLLAADLVSSMKDFAPGSGFLGMGGEKMMDAGVDIVCHIRDLQMLGVAEILKNIGKFREAQRRLIERARKEGVKTVILVDSPGFNIPFGLKVKRELKCRIIYYVPPQVWAWWTSRIRVIRKFVDIIFVILPFEAAFYRRYGIDARYFGCPLLDIIDRRAGQLKSWDITDKNRKEIITILPGSRRYEIALNLPIMLKSAQLISAKEPNVKFVICCASAGLRISIDKTVSSFNGSLDIDIVENKTYEIMKSSRLALVAAGMATTEAAILSVPFIVVYKLPLASWYFLRLSLKVNSSVLINLVLGKPVIPEFIQHRAIPNEIANTGLRLLQDAKEIEIMKIGFDSFKRCLGGESPARHIARSIVEAIN